MLLRVLIVIGSVLVPCLVALAFACFTVRHPIDLAFIASFYATGNPQTDLTNRFVLLGPGVIGLVLSVSLMLLEKHKQLQKSRWWLVLLWFVTCVTLSVLLIAGVVAVS